MTNLRYFQTSQNAVLTRKLISFAGVKNDGFEWETYVINCGAASTGESRQRFKAESYHGLVINSIVAVSAINFNIFARCYV